MPGGCSGGHNIQLCPQEDQDQTLVGTEEDGGSENEEEIQAWLDNKDWTGMSILSCKDDTEEGNTNLNTLREVFDQDRILTLMDTSDPPTLRHSIGGWGVSCTHSTAQGSGQRKAPNAPGKGFSCNN